MKLLFLFWNKGIFRRLVLTFLLVLIPVCSLGIYIYSLGTNAVKKEISNSMQTQIDSYLENFEKEMGRIKLLQSDLVNDVNLNKLADIPGTMNLYNRAEAVMNFQQRLIAIKSSSVYIKDIITIIPEMRDTISISGLSEMTDEENELLYAIPDSEHNYFYCWKNRLFLSFMRPLELGKAKKLPRFLIAVELSENELKTALKQSNIYKGSDALLMNSLEGYVISTNENPDITLQFKKSLWEHLERKKILQNTIEISGMNYQMFYTLPGTSHLVLAKYIPIGFMFKPLKHFSIWLWVFSAASVIIIILFSYLTYKSIHKPIKDLVDAFRLVENGDLDVSIDHRHNDEFRYMYKRFDAMVENIKVLIDQVYNQKILAQKAELKHLQSQINPHFLYNSYFILSSMIENEDYDSTKRFAKQLGSYFQYITRSMSDEVKLSLEVAHSRTYAEIQARRYRSRIKLEFGSLPAEYENLIVPRLIIQPLIENAFEHGLENTQKNGIVKIHFEVLNKFLFIVVEDNGSGMNEEDMERVVGTLSSNAHNIETTGVVNIHRRIQLKFGKSSGLEVLRGKESGLRVVIKICIG